MNSTQRAGLKTVGLFAGIGGLELGLEKAGHTTIAFCENHPSATAVLEKQFDGIPVRPDVRKLIELPSETELLTAGFPCQDLSQAGRTRGIRGAKSSLVGEIFRLVEKQRIPWLLLENVPFMLRLAKGHALEVVVSALEELDYKWAYRVIDSRAFGLPQRRERVFILASQHEDPRDVLLSKDHGAPPNGAGWPDVACGFYWTEGNTGLGWAVNAVPTLKGGSTVGIPSPPAILMPDGQIVTPSISSAEEMQGFQTGWTEPALDVGRASLRWLLVGNAVTVNVAEWIGEQLVAPGKYVANADSKLTVGAVWPTAAYNVGEGRFSSDASAWPVRARQKSLASFVEGKRGSSPLSRRATAGFLKRFEASSLRKPPGLIPALQAHLEKMERLEEAARKAKEQNAGKASRKRRRP